LRYTGSRRRDTGAYRDLIGSLVAPASVDIQPRTVGPEFVEKQLSEAAQLLLVPGECDGAVGRAIEFRRKEKGAVLDVDAVSKCRVAWAGQSVRHYRFQRQERHCLRLARLVLL
jgi:hypothetical protein